MQIGQRALTLALVASSALTACGSPNMAPSSPHNPDNYQPSRAGTPPNLIVYERERWCDPDHAIGSGWVATDMFAPPNGQVDTKSSAPRNTLLTFEEVDEGNGSDEKFIARDHLGANKLVITETENERVDPRLGHVEEESMTMDYNGQRVMTGKEVELPRYNIERETADVRLNGQNQPFVSNVEYMLSSQGSGGQSEAVRAGSLIQSQDTKGQTQTFFSDNSFAWYSGDYFQVKTTPETARKLYEPNSSGDYPSHSQVKSQVGGSKDLLYKVRVREGHNEGLTYTDKLGQEFARIDYGPTDYSQGAGMRFYGRDGGGQMKELGTIVVLDSGKDSNGDGFVKPDDQHYNAPEGCNLQGKAGNRSYTMAAYLNGSSKAEKIANYRQMNQIMSVAPDAVNEDWKGMSKVEFLGDVGLFAVETYDQKTPTLRTLELARDISAEEDDGSYATNLGTLLKKPELVRTQPLTPSFVGATQSSAPVDWGNLQPTGNERTYQGDNPSH